MSPAAERRGPGWTRAPGWWPSPATSLAAERLRDGLPLRAEIAVVGYVATRPGSDGAGWDG